LLPFAAGNYAEMAAGHVIRIVLIVVGTLLVLNLVGFLIGYWVFESGGTMPESGTGGIITSRTP
jgi:hypothetical protein